MPVYLSDKCVYIVCVVYNKPVICVVLCSQATSHIADQIKEKHGEFESFFIECSSLHW